MGKKKKYTKASSWLMVDLFTASKSVSLASIKNSFFFVRHRWRPYVYVMIGIPTCVGGFTQIREVRLVIGMQIADGWPVNVYLPEVVVLIRSQ